MEYILNVHYAGEIGLKGGKRSEFENRLIQNIRSMINNSGLPVSNTKIKIRKSDGRIRIETDPSNIEAVITPLKRVFGIEWFSQAICTERKIEKIEQVVDAATVALPRKTIRVETRRVDKTFPLTSQQVNERIGQRLKETGFGIDLDNPGIMVYIEILRSDALVSVAKEPGAGGLPVGSAGKVLTLFSGGIDSPVAAWLMMKRGCSVEYLHVHPYPDSDRAKTSKIVRILENIRAYSPVPLRLHLASYMDFYQKTTQLPARYELVLFRRFLIRLASAIAKDTGALGLVTGDSIGQVASQTLENLKASEGISEFPVYRPLLTYGKEEIIERARKIGTYIPSISEYRDCCSLVASRHPATKADGRMLDRLEQEIDMGSIVEKTKETIEQIEVDRGP